MAFQGFKSCSGRITGSHADVLVTLSKRIPGWSYKKEKDSRDKDRDRDGNRDRDRESKEGVRKNELNKGNNNISNQPASDSQISLRRYLFHFLLFLLVFIIFFFLFYISSFIFINDNPTLSFPTFPFLLFCFIVIHGVYSALWGISRLDRQTLPVRAVLKVRISKRKKHKLKL